MKTLTLSLLVLLVSGCSSKPDDRGFHANQWAIVDTVMVDGCVYVFAKVGYAGGLAAAVNQPETCK